MAEEVDTKKLRLRAWCGERLALHQQAALSDPLASGVRMLTIDLWDRLVRGEISCDELSALAKSISDDALTARAERLKAKARSADWTSVLENALASREGAEFGEVKDFLAQTGAGVVFTGHPTFALSRQLRDDIGALASGDKTHQASNAAHAPDPAISLLDEHEDVQTAIAHAQAALGDLYSACFLWLRSRYPGVWWKARPALLSLATWVGYDLDGRTDIHWGTTLRLRLEEKAVQLSRYSQTLAELPGAEEIARELADAASEADEQAQFFSAKLDDPAAMVAAANRLTEDRHERLLSLTASRIKSAAL
ncbi:MAG: hypothetical protein AAB227_12050 [Pseudomonadota bacterium]